MKYFMILCFIVLSYFIFTDTSDAAPITFIYEGAINNTGGDPASTPFDFFMGDTLRVVYTFESNTSDNNPSMNGDYLDAIIGISVTVGGNLYTASSGNIIIINNDVNPDQYLVDITELIGPDVGGIPVDSFRLIFSDFSHSVFTSDELPVVQPNPSAFSMASLELSYDDHDFPFNSFGIIIADGTVNSVQISSVPASNDVLLIVSGLIILFSGVRAIKNHI